MTDRHAFADDVDLGEPLLTAVEGIRSEPISDDVLNRVEGRLMELSPRATSTLSAFNSKSRRTRRLLWPSCVVTTLLLAVCLGLILLRQPSAWAQVIRAVANEPWMRLTLQKPKLEKPADKEPPGIVFWFSGDHKIAANVQQTGIRWLDVPKNDEWVFDPKTGTIRRGVVGAFDSQYVQLMLELLNQFEDPLPDKRQIGANLIERKQDVIMEDGKNWDRFTCIFEDERTTPKRQTFVVRVDKKTHRPVELQILRGEKTDPFLPLRFTIDFPKEGPRDIYALSVPRKAPIIDTRDVDKYFKPRKRPEPTDYEAIVIHCSAHQPLALISDAERFRHNSAGTTSERADGLKLFELSLDVHSGRLGPSKTPPVRWWVEAVDRLPMEHYKAGETNMPHNACYRAYGGPSDYESVRESDGTLPGLERTMELRGPRMSVWLDPKRDLIVRRLEQVLADGTISVWQCDEVEKDPDGTWFAKRVRRGKIEKRGAPLDDEQPTAGISVSLSITKLTFPEERGEESRSK